MKCCRAGRLLAYKTMRKTNIFKPHRANPQQPLWDTSGKIHSILSNSLDGIRVLLWRSSWGGAIYRPLQTLSWWLQWLVVADPKEKALVAFSPEDRVASEEGKGSTQLRLKVRLPLCLMTQAHFAQTVVGRVWGLLVLFPTGFVPPPPRWKQRWWSTSKHNAT